MIQKTLADIARDTIVTIDDRAYWLERSKRCTCGLRMSAYDTELRDGPFAIHAPSCPLYSLPPLDTPEEGEATARKAIQLVRVEPNDLVSGSLVALYDDGSVYECLDGSTVWNEVEVP